MSEWLNTKEACDMASVSARTLARWAREGRVASKKDGRNRLYERASLAAIVTPENTVTIAGIELRDIRVLVFDGRPFFCVEDVRRWLVTTTDVHRLVEGVPSGHKSLLRTSVPLNQRGDCPMSGVIDLQAGTWHVSIGGLQIIAARCRPGDREEVVLAVDALLSWAADVVESVALGRPPANTPADLPSIELTKQVDRQRRITIDTYERRAMTHTEMRKTLRRLVYAMGFVDSMDLPTEGLVPVQGRLGLVVNDDMELGHGSR